MNNDALERNVLRELLADDSIDASRINARTESTTVILTGSVSTYYELWNANDDAWRVGGVTDVQNDIVVDLASDASSTENWSHPPAPVSRPTGSCPKAL